MPAKPLFRDPVCTWIDHTELSDAIAVARDMRGCTRTLAVGPNFFLANGPSGVRCFFELGIHNVILDLRLLGTPAELWKGVTEAARLGAKGITLSAFSGPSALKIAKEAAVASQRFTLKVEPIRLLVTMVPDTVQSAELVDDLQLRVKRTGHVRRVAELVKELQLDGIVTEFDDTATIWRVSRKISMVVAAQRGPRNYTESLNEQELEKPGILECMHANASHVLLNADLLARVNVEWAADMVTKELDMLNEGEGNGTRRYNLSGASLCD